MSDKTQEFFDAMRDLPLDAYAMEVVDADYRPIKITGWYIQSGILRVEIADKPPMAEVLTGEDV